MISAGYQAEQRRMHEAMPDYGVECLRYVDTIAAMIINHEIKTMLDYGAGKGRIVPALGKALNGAGDIEVQLYDPGVPEIAERPDPCQLVTCIDVLEHVEPEFTLPVLDDILYCTERFAFITIGMTPAAKVLSDGRNAHINLRPSAEWMGLLMERFKMIYAVDKGRSLIFLGKPL